MEVRSCLRLDGDDVVDVKLISGGGGSTSGEERKRKRRMVTNLRPSAKILRSDNRSSNRWFSRTDSLRVLAHLLYPLRCRPVSSPKILNQK